jgi:HSP20 family protein
MLNLTPYTRHSMKPFDEDFASMQRIFDNFFDSNFFPAHRLDNEMLTSMGSFKLDVREEDNAYLIDAELPGILKEYIDLNYQNEQLTISVKQSEEVDNSKDNYIHRERKFSAMQRSIYLKNVKSESISAKLENGILKINVPKSELSESKRSISID